MKAAAFLLLLAVSLTSARFLSKNFASKIYAAFLANSFANPGFRISTVCRGPYKEHAQLSTWSRDSPYGITVGKMASLNEDDTYKLWLNVTYYTVHILLDSSFTYDLEEEDYDFSVMTLGCHFIADEDLERFSMSGSEDFAEALDICELQEKPQSIMASSVHGKDTCATGAKRWNRVSVQVSEDFALREVQRYLALSKEKRDMYDSPVAGRGTVQINWRSEEENTKVVIGIGDQYSHETLLRITFGEDLNHDFPTTSAKVVIPYLNSTIHISFVTEETVEILNTFFDVEIETNEKLIMYSYNYEIFKLDKYVCLTILDAVKSYQKHALTGINYEKLETMNFLDQTTEIVKHVNVVDHQVWEYFIHKTNPEDVEHLERILDEHLRENTSAKVSQSLKTEDFWYQGMLKTADRLNQTMLLITTSSGSEKWPSLTHELKELMVFNDNGGWELCMANTSWVIVNVRAEWAENALDHYEKIVAFNFPERFRVPTIWMDFRAFERRLFQTTLQFPVSGLAFAAIFEIRTLTGELTVKAHDPTKPEPFQKMAKISYELVKGGNSTDTELRVTYNIQWDLINDYTNDLVDFITEMPDILAADIYDGKTMLCGLLESITGIDNIVDLSPPRALKSLVDIIISLFNGRFPVDTSIVTEEVEELITTNNEYMHFEENGFTINLTKLKYLPFSYLEEYGIDASFVKFISRAFDFYTSQHFMDMLKVLGKHYG